MDKAMDTLSWGPGFAPHPRRARLSIRALGRSRRR